MLSDDFVSDPVIEETEEEPSEVLEEVSSEESEEEPFEEPEEETSEELEEESSEEPEEETSEEPEEETSEEPEEETSEESEQVFEESEVLDNESLLQSINYDFIDYSDYFENLQTIGIVIICLLVGLIVSMSFLKGFKK